MSDTVSCKPEDPQAARHQQAKQWLDDFKGAAIALDADRLKATLHQVARGIDTELEELAKAGQHTLGQVLNNLPPDADGATVHLALADAWDGLSRGVREAYLNAVPVETDVEVVWSGTVREEDPPAPILWRASYADDPVVSAGEAAVLAGAGSAGKTWLATDFAVKADHAAKRGEKFGDACGLQIAAGNVVIITYEMSLKRLDMVADALGAPDGILSINRPPPLFPLDRETREHGEGPAWRATWDAIAKFNPVLVVIDTGPKAMGGVDPNDTAAAIAFLQGIEREVQAFDRCAALVIAHDTKEVRDAARRGADVGAGAIAGSGQWYDSPRGVLHLSKVRGSDTRFIECLKASNGRQHWGARLVPMWEEGTGEYAGLGLDEDGLIGPGGMAQARKDAQPDDDASTASRNRQSRKKRGGSTTDGSGLD